MRALLMSGLASQVDWLVLLALVCDSVPTRRSAAPASNTPSSSSVRSVRLPTRLTSAIGSVVTSRYCLRSAAATPWKRGVMDQSQANA